MDPAAVARFLRSCPGLNKQTIGELLGEHDDFFLEVLRYFTETFDFTGDPSLSLALCIEDTFSRDPSFQPFILLTCDQHLCLTVFFLCVAFPAVGGDALSLSSTATWLCLSWVNLLGFCYHSVIGGIAEATHLGCQPLLRPPPPPPPPSRPPSFTGHMSGRH